ncbi:MAG TPA: ascorbate-dependent monooxygenase, partial [Verrucomicrobiae bacterium]|nr:ascorbate-dependent monooxygenase [Verrucomicrobiae bacterium]
MKRMWLVAMILACGGIWLVSAAIQAQDAATTPPVTAAAKAPLTFNKDVAPIVFARCSRCHRPGESGPFNLLTYADVKKHADQIVEVTAKRYMPPWLPEPGYGDFANSRRLSDAEVTVFRDWVAAGAVEGNAADLPPMPAWTEGWQLGKPDLVLKAAAPFHLPSEGRDVYRNLIVPTSLPGRRHVRAFEFHPGNSKVVHHAFVKMDPTRQSRRLEGKDGEPGFPGMSVPDSVIMPDGQFMGWQPGRLPAENPLGLAWNLEPGADLVLQLHLRLTGKPETVQPEVGLYFTDLPPQRTCYKFLLTSLVLDIPPGQADYTVQDDFTLPVDT